MLENYAEVMKMDYSSQKNILPQVKCYRVIQISQSPVCASSATEDNDIILEKQKLSPLVHSTRGSFNPSLLYLIFSFAVICNHGMGLWMVGTQQSLLAMF